MNAYSYAKAIDCSHLLYIQLKCIQEAKKVQSNQPIKN